MLSSLLVKPFKTLAALAGWKSDSFSSITKRLARLTSEPTALAFSAPLIRSPSQWPGNWRSSISGGRRWMLSMSGICGHADPPPCFAVRAYCARGAGRQSILCATPQQEWHRRGCRGFRATRGIPWPLECSGASVSAICSGEQRRRNKCTTRCRRILSGRSLGNGRVKHLRSTH